MRLLASLARIALGATALASVASSQVLHVDANLSTGANDGSTWADAFQGELGLQQALSLAAAGDQLFVAQGTYKPTGTGSRTVSFNLINDVEIYGGFLGGESSVAERPPIGTAPSVLLGDLDGNDAGTGTFGDNSYHVIRTAGTNSSAVLDGFTVQAGNASGGGANNDRGGGILCAGNVSPTIRNCRFLLNRCSFGGAAGYINNGGAPTFTDCSFEQGTGGSYGGAFDIASGGSVRFDRCLFLDNTAARAGALEVFATSGVFVTNCVFQGNVATGSSGGGAIWMGSGGNTRVRNCTIVGNSATNSNFGGIRDQGSSNESVVNCVLWNNAGSTGATGSTNQVNNGVSVQYSIVQGGYPGSGNLGSDPLLSDIAGGDLSLGAGSPAIDAGANAGVPIGITLDFAQNPRFVDDPDVADSGLGPAPIVDIGAYESAPGPFDSVAGCAGNPAVLSSTTPSFAVGQALGFQLDSATQPSGLALYYVGVDGTDVAGCGVVLPGLGELLLGFVPAAVLLGSAPVAGGSGSFGLNLPSSPALAGQTLGFQAANADLLAPGVPIELSNLLVGTIAP